MSTHHTTGGAAQPGSARPQAAAGELNRATLGGQDVRDAQLLELLGSGEPVDASTSQLGAELSAWLDSIDDDQPPAYRVSDAEFDALQALLLADIAEMRAVVSRRNGEVS